MSRWLGNHPTDVGPLTVAGVVAVWLAPGLITLLYLAVEWLIRALA